MTTISSAGSLPVTVLVGAPVVSVTPDANLHQVADALTANDISALVVGDDDDTPIGIVTERDLAGALAARGNPAITHASDIAHTSLVWCDATASVIEVAALMMDRYVRHVLVEADGQLVGIVSARDLLGAYVASDESLNGDDA